jgi:hypothetical protein
MINVAFPEFLNSFLISILHIGKVLGDDVVIACHAAEEAG